MFVHILKGVLDLIDCLNNKFILDVNGNLITA